MANNIRPIRVEGSLAYITLTRGLEAVIDAVDVPAVEGRSWCADPAPDTHYVVSAVRVGGKKRKQYLHRILADASSGLCVDHINRNGLDNRRENLRVCTVAENARNAKTRCDNKAGLKGVSYIKKDKKWLAQIKVGQRNFQLGYFTSAEAGHRAYCEASARLHGEFGRVA